jgi:pimeloyl-ACP methyl ester carboxylesterase
MTLTGLINRRRQYIVDHRLTDVRLFGSSLGGLVALQYAHLFGGVGKMLLLAPAVAYQPEWIDETVLQQWKESGSRDVFHYAFNTLLPLWYTYYLDGQHYAEAVPRQRRTLIIHGEQDEVVSVAHSRAYVDASPTAPA